MDETDVSRIDKLLLDRDAAKPEESRQRRASRAVGIAVGDDARGSYGLQLALLTAVNLGTRTFGTASIVYMSAHLAEARNMVPVARGVTLREAIVELGGKVETGAGITDERPYLLLGKVDSVERALRVTFDGWMVAVGPAAELNRLRERDYCPLAGAAAAAIGLEELFAEFAGINIMATRRVIVTSLWRPDLRDDDPAAVGEPLAEIPNELAMFGLGHLGQAYLWAFVALRHADPSKATIALCDDDNLEPPNLETGAIATTDWLEKRKTRMAAHWLEARGYQTRLLERRIDKHFRRVDAEPVLALSGFDDNWPRQWLSDAGFAAMFDTGLGGEAFNFDTIAFRAWPNTRPVTELWPIETDEEIAARKARRQKALAEGGYDDLGEDECGRLRLAEKSVAVPFVGMYAACTVLAEVLKAINGGPVFYEIKIRLCSLPGCVQGRLAHLRAHPMRRVSVQACGTDTYKAVEALSAHGNKAAHEALPMLKKAFSSPPGPGD
jgi:hypothetical protein